MGFTKRFPELFDGIKEDDAYEMKNCRSFAWQSSFYDHIIRNAKSFENIQNYIKNNPINWGKDKLKG